MIGLAAAGRRCIGSASERQWKSLVGATALVSQQVRNKLYVPLEPKGEKKDHPRAIGTIKKKIREKDRSRRRTGKPRYYGKRNTKEDIRRLVDEVTGTPGLVFEQQDEEASEFPTPWNIRFAGIIDRWPEITPEPPQWEVDMLQLQELRRKQFGRELPDDLGIDTSHKISNTEGDDFETKKESPPVRVTKDDLEDNRRSLDRALERMLYLLVKPKGQDWCFPSAEPMEGRKMRNGLMFNLIGDLGKEIELYPASYSPLAFTQTPYSEEQQKELQTYGEKVFYFRYTLAKGRVKISKKRYDDYAWITVDQLPDYFKDEKFCHYMKHVLGPLF